MSNNTTSMALEDMPVYKLQQKGRAALSDSEILSIVIGHGMKPEASLSLSKAILKYVNYDLYSLASLTVLDLMRNCKTTKLVATKLVAAFELDRRKRNTVTINRQMKSSLDIYDFISPYLSDLDCEHFYTLFLDRRNQVLKCDLIGLGSAEGVVVDVKKIMRLALQHKAASIILSHNHPSGRAERSDADLSITKQIKEAGKVLDIQLLDHIIVGKNTYYSFVDEGIL